MKAFTHESGVAVLAIVAIAAFLGLALASTTCW